MEPTTKNPTYDELSPFGQCVADALKATFRYENTPPQITAMLQQMGLSKEELQTFLPEHELQLSLRTDSLAADGINAIIDNNADFVVGCLDQLTAPPARGTAGKKALHHAARR